MHHATGAAIVIIRFSVLYLASRVLQRRCKIAPEATLLLLDAREFSTSDCYDLLTMFDGVNQDGCSMRNDAGWILPPGVERPWIPGTTTYRTACWSIQPALLLVQALCAEQAQRVRWLLHGRRSVEKTIQRHR